MLAAALAAFLVWTQVSCQRAGGEWHGDQKLIILGIDGMDPQLLERFIKDGKMPNTASERANLWDITAPGQGSILVQ